MQTLNPTRKRTRAGMALMALAVSTAGVLTAVSPASAAAVHPDAVDSAVAAPATGRKIKVTWVAPSAGESVDNYVITFDNPGTAVTPDYTEVVAGNLLTYTWSAPESTTDISYDIEIFTKNAYPGFGGPTTPTDSPVLVPATTVPIDCSAPGAPVPPCPAPDTRDYRPFDNWNDLITQEYQDWLGRAPRMDEEIFWRQFITGGGDPFNNRQEFVTWLAEEAEQTDGPAYRLYTAYFSRNPDFGGLTYWSQKLRTDGSLLAISTFFVNSSEFKNTYGEYETYATEGPKTDAAEFVALIYQNVLDRTPDGSGFAFWTRQLQTERYSPAEVLIGFSESQEFKTRMAPRVATGMAFVHMLDRVPTEDEYVLAEFYGDLFPTSPDFFGYSGVTGLYETIIDSAAYKARVA